jgi:hypothetical protein
MPIFSGSTSTSANSTSYAIPYKIKSIRLVNKTGGAITANVSLLYGSTNIWITPLNKSISANDYYVYDPVDIDLPPSYIIHVLVNGSCDYTISLE